MGKTIQAKVSQIQGAIGVTKESEKTLAVKKKACTITSGEAFSALMINYQEEVVSTRPGYELASSNEAVAGVTTLVVTDLLDAPSGGQFYVRKCETEDTEPSNWCALPTGARDAAPTDLTATNATGENANDGQIDGVTTDMEYSANAGETWTHVTENPITGLAKGEYLVRFAATDSKVASKAASIIVDADSEGEVITGSIGVSITRDDATDTRGVIVSVERGNDVVDSKSGTLSAETIVLTFNHLPDGNYNVVCKTVDNKFTETKLLTIQDGEEKETEFQVLNANVASIVDVQDGAPKLAVEALTVPVHRLYNTKTGEHLYTIDTKEQENLLKNHAVDGWVDEGLAWYVSAQAGKPVYRLNDMTGGKGHIYTTDMAVKSEYITKGWRDEGIAWYSPVESGRIIYKLTDFKTGQTIYTISQTEKDTLQNAGYTCQEADFVAY